MKNNHFNFTHHYSHAESKDFCIEAELNRKWRNDFLNRLVFQACVCVSYILRVLHSEDLLSEVLQVIKGRLGCDGVDQSKTLTVLHVKVSHCCELLLQTEGFHTHRQMVRGTDRYNAWPTVCQYVDIIV